MKLEGRSSKKPFFNDQIKTLSTDCRCAKCRTMLIEFHNFEFLSNFEF
jgi:hypothetical protein